MAPQYQYDEVSGGSDRITERLRGSGPEASATRLASAHHGLERWQQRLDGDEELEFGVWYKACNTEKGALEMPDKI